MDDQPTRVAWNCSGSNCRPGDGRSRPGATCEEASPTQRLGGSIARERTRTSPGLSGPGVRCRRAHGRRSGPTAGRGCSCFDMATIWHYNRWTMTHVARCGDETDLSWDQHSGRVYLRPQGLVQHPHSQSEGRCSLLPEQRAVIWLAGMRPKPEKRGEGTPPPIHRDLRGVRRFRRILVRHTVAILCATRAREAEYNDLQDLPRRSV